MKWKFKYDHKQQDPGWRNNPETYLEACEKLHQVFCEFSQNAGISSEPVYFEQIKDKVSEIICLEADGRGRTEAWKAAIRQNQIFKSDENEALSYSEKAWEKQKKAFKDLRHSSDVAQCEVYQFHQAATYHRDYTLKQLLPGHGIIVL